ncbi:hypothetical protein [Streptomonospora wellingtoniae]|uniref:Uncharacterized protein n=1 Tax=Streptomonospora wellingtoniae TaxID=3075544 RepID=A0ABU2KUH5_9ACTN|nr:hypothetical protein [Streptomonospora sp. DSM 45055]MDT0302944.1 hypothetical protein [Streptomonospora sp. DSM 45055]
MDTSDAYEHGLSDGQWGGQSLYPESLPPEQRAAYESGLTDGAQK